MTPTEARANAAANGAKCTKCPGSKASGCIWPIQHTNDRQPRLIIVTEKPSEADTKAGELLSGSSGREFGKQMDRLGVDKADCFLTSAVLCNIPKSDIAKARKCCLPRLQRELDQYPDSDIIALGSTALQSVENMGGHAPNIVDWRGSVIRRRPVEQKHKHASFLQTQASDSGQLSASTGRLLFPTLSPREVALKPEWTGVWLGDLKRAARLTNPFNRPWREPELDQDRYTVIPYHSFDRELLALGTPVSLDIETTGLDTQTCEMLCLGLSDGVTTIVIPWRELTSSMKDEARNALNWFLSHSTVITHNGPSYDFVVLRRLGFRIGKWEDTLNASHVLNSHLPRKLGHVASCYLDLPPWKRGAHDDQESLYKYNAADCLYTRLLWDHEAADIRFEGLQAVYNCDKATAELCSRMQSVGFAFDKERAAELSTAMRQRESELESEAAALIGHPANLLAPSSLNKTFFFELKAPVYFRTKTGKAQLNAEALRGYIAHPNDKISGLAQIVLDYRAARKARVTYVDNIVIGPDGRIHPNWRNYGAVTGRWACGNPNLANLSKPQNDPTAQLGGIRSLYIAKPGYVLVGFDAKQLEMRLAAYLSGDEAMIAACESSDLHAANARLIWPDYDQQPKSAQKELRDLAKTAGFAVVYGASALTVHSRLVAMGKTVSLKQVEAMLQRIRRIFPRFFKWQEELVAATIRRGYVYSPIVGRRKWTGHNPSKTETGNFPIQSGAADFFNLRLPRLARLLPSKCEIVAHVYDAAYIETPESFVEEVKGLCYSVFEAPIELSGRSVVLPIDCKVGYRWSDV